jgi:hypothetical protein
VYGLLGYFDHDMQRWTATLMIAIVLPVTIAITRALSVREAKAHERGIDKGIEKVSKAAQDTATIRANMHTTIKPPAATMSAPARNWDDLLPRPERGAAIVARSGGDNTPIDL